MSIALCNMGNVYLERCKFDKALKCFERNLKISEELDDKRNIAITLGNMGRLYNGINKQTKAIKYLNRAISLFEVLGLKYFLCEFLLEKANILFELGKFSASEELARKCKKTALKIGRKDTLDDCKKLIEKLSTVSG